MSKKIKRKAHRKASAPKRIHAHRASDYEPSGIEIEVGCVWQDFAEAHGFWVTDNSRMHGVAQISHEIGYECSFIVNPPADPNEDALYEEFIATMRNQLVEYRGEVFRVLPTVLLLRAGSRVKRLIGWRVYKESDGTFLSPKRLDAYRNVRVRTAL